MKCEIQNFFYGQEISHYPSLKLEIDGCKNENKKKSIKKPTKKLKKFKVPHTRVKTNKKKFVIVCVNI